MRRDPALRIGDTLGAAAGRDPVDVTPPSGAVHRHPRPNQVIRPTHRRSIRLSHRDQATRTRHRYATFDEAERILAP